MELEAGSQRSEVRLSAYDFCALCAFCLIILAIITFDVRFARIKLYKIIAQL